jgi:hypothetical protein
VSRILLATLALTVGVIFPAHGQADESLKVGTSIARPEAISGAWEARLASGDTVGLSIALIATVDGAATTLRGVQQQIRFINIVTYLRSGDHTKRTWWHSDMPGDFSFQHNRLRLREHDRVASLAVDLDLVFDPQQSRWTGLLRNAETSQNVVLLRPGGAEPTAPIGTWRWAPSGDGQSYCIHIGMGADRRLVMWSDVITLNGLFQYTNGQHPPARTDEMYAELAQDPMERRVGNGWRFKLGGWLGGSNITGELSDDGSTFAGEQMHYGNGVQDQHPHAFVWQRVAGTSCANAMTPLPGPSGIPRSGAGPPRGRG